MWLRCCRGISATSDRLPTRVCGANAYRANRDFSSSFSRARIWMCECVYSSARRHAPRSCTPCWSLRLELARFPAPSALTTHTHRYALATGVFAVVLNLYVFHFPPLHSPVVPCATSSNFPCIFSTQRLALSALALSLSSCICGVLFVLLHSLPQFLSFSISFPLSSPPFSTLNLSSPCSHFLLPSLTVPALAL